tara:strand:+ start:46 stop:402 length:357 start_codon:yes stop_codon:yes gene_type:complete
MTINVSEALDSDTGEIITATRTNSGNYIDGLYVKGSSSTFKTICSVQPATAVEIQNLPEGERTKDIRKFISKKPLRTTDEKNSIIADTVRYKTRDYKIISAGDWDTYGHTTSFGARVQ